MKWNFSPIKKFVIIAKKTKSSKSLTLQKIILNFKIKSKK